MESRNIFISSTTRDLNQYRQEAGEVIEQLNQDFKGRFLLNCDTMHTKVQDGERKTAVEVSRGWIRKADWVVLIVGWNYGFVPPNQKISVTEWEYIEATEQSKKCFVFVSGDPDKDGDRGYYPKREREPVPLSKWTTKDEVDRNPKGWESVCRFRKELISNQGKLFPHIDEFRNELKRTLREAVIDALTGVGGRPPTGASTSATSKKPRATASGSSPAPTSTRS